VISDLRFEMLQTESYVSQYLPLNMQTQTLQLLFKTVPDPLFFNSLIDFGSRLKKKLQQQQAQTVMGDLVSLDKTKIDMLDIPHKKKISSNDNYGTSGLGK